MALTSKNFCMSAWATFWLIVRNCARFSMVSGIGFILMFVGKMTICTLSGWISYLIIMNAPVFKDKIYSPIFPVIIVVFIAYLISSVFLSIFSFSATAILHCFILDSELAKKGGRNATPESLTPFIEKNDQLNAKYAMQLKAQGGADNVKTEQMQVHPSNVNLTEKKANQMS